LAPKLVAEFCNTFASVFICAGAAAVVDNGGRAFGALEDWRKIRVIAAMQITTLALDRRR
jgi:hypothetical protein